jgi:hypothetical protein
MSWNKNSLLTIKALYGLFFMALFVLIGVNPNFVASQFG